MSDRLTLARACLLRADVARGAGDMEVALLAMEAAAAHLGVAIDAARAGARDDLEAALGESVRLARRGTLLRVIRGGRR